MDEIVFFNPGDSIGNFHDHNEAVKTAQIYKEKQDQNKRVLVVHGVNNKGFDIFLADDIVSHDNEKGAVQKPYKVSDRL
ncbi:hypothetical protein YK48G_03740 [Lentilactobacillus fungorum]|uniref:Uncharacterized protein n=1 Tax=Lentilactobacillus fungorum TaxID=2201250 RepID=A0ABQ3VYI2_9LACO|nr:hypothetical protein [Lentilactobacillus fungorum]GHP12949.1 hypothetical protein YK48G_03740 [Lentilactobacillus fungorum]